MMKKTIFGKFLAIAMIFAGFSLTSCDEKDNAIIDGQVYVKPEVQLVDGGAVITATTISDINKMIAHIRKDVMEYAAENPGEPITIKIDAPALTTALSENTIGLPTANGTDIIVEFTNPIATSDDAPLIIQSIGVADNAWTAPSDNVVEINFAAGTSDIDLGLNMPKSTVTLKGATIDELVALTGWETLIIESDVTVNWLLNKGGKIIVKEGAEVLGALVEDGIDITAEGVILYDTFENEIPEGFNDMEWDERLESFIRVNNVKVIGNEDHPANINIQAYGEEPEDIAEVDVIIEDGVKTTVNYNGPYDYPYHAIVNITGEGDNAQIVPSGSKPKTGELAGKICAYRDLSFINKLSNVTVDITTVYGYWDENLEEGVDEEAETEFVQDFTLPQNSENCTFIAPYYSFRTNQDNNSASFKDCTFKYGDIETSEDKDLRVKVDFPVQTEDRTSFDLSFDNCNFDKVFKFDTNFKGEWAVFDGYEALITLENVKMDGKAVTKNTEMIQNITKVVVEDEAKTTTLFAIDGVKYEPRRLDGPDNQWILMEVEAEE